MLKHLTFSYIEKYGLILINFGSSIILARLLSPDEIGIFSIVIFVVSLAHTVRDLGVSSYIIQETELKTNHIKSAQLVTIAMSWGMAGILFLVSKPASDFYAEPQVQEIMFVLITNFVLLPFGSVTAALLRRDLKFEKLSKINITTALIQATTSIGMAGYGYGATSLAWGAVAGTSASVILLMLNRNSDQPWMPGTKSIKRVLDKGIKYSGASAFYDIGQGAPELISAKILSFHETGLLSRGTGAATLIHRLLIEAILPVLLSHFATILRTNPRQFRLDFLNSVTNTATVAWPAFACFSLISSDVIYILYGTSWMGAAPIASILCFGYAFAGLGGIASSVIIGAGEASLTLKAQGYIQTTKVICALVGANFGINGVAMAISLVDIAGAIFLNTIVCRKYNIAIKSVFYSLQKPAIATVIITILSASLKTNLEGTSEIIRLAIITPTVVTVWVFLIYKLQIPLWDTLSQTTQKILLKSTKNHK